MSFIFVPRPTQVTCSVSKEKTELRVLVVYPALPFSQTNSVTELSKFGINATVAVPVSSDGHTFTVIITADMENGLYTSRYKSLPYDN